MVRRGDVAAVDRAISSGWDVNRDDGFSATTALLVACEADRADVVALLLGHGADPNVRHRDNWNCYDSSRSRRVRELLVAHGFDGARRNDWAEAWLSCACSGRALASPGHGRPRCPAPSCTSVPRLRLPHRRVGRCRHRRRTAEYAATVEGPATSSVHSHIRRERRHASRAAITLTLGGYRGDFRVRLFCSADRE
jgi:hypothetical protein